jgi:hypothetical protein
MRNLVTHQLLRRSAVLCMTLFRSSRNVNADGYLVHCNSVFADLDEFDENDDEDDADDATSTTTHDASSDERSHRAPSTHKIETSVSPKQTTPESSLDVSTTNTQQAVQASDQMNSAATNEALSTSSSSTSQQDLPASTTSSTVTTTSQAVLPQASICSENVPTDKKDQVIDSSNPSNAKQAHRPSKFAFV